MVESTFTTAGFCVVSAVLAILLRQNAREQSMFIALAACTAVAAGLLSFLAPAVDDIRSIFLSSGLPESYISLIFKAAAICFITQITADICRDSGETAIASAAEMWGRGAIAFLSIPLVRALIEQIGAIL